MPWTITDVEEHKKGLSDKGKAQWVRIANSVLKKLMAKGITEKKAAASAIKQANGVVNANSENNSYSSYRKKQVLDYEVKLTLHQKKAHMVAPVVMMVEGVHNGSQGPLLHEISELGKFPASWNGIPIIIYHPTTEEGEPISANDPDIVDNMVVGRVYNTEVDGKKLKAEAWFDEDQLNTVSPETLQDINDGKEIEVSLGMFTENEMVAGSYEDEDYVGIAHNHRPDHLAILPDQIGACSCKDGCGVGANQKNENMERTKKPKTEEMIETLSLAGYVVNQIAKYGETGYNELISMIYDKLRTLDKDFEDENGTHHYTYNYLEECYDDNLIYSSSSEGTRKMYKQEYKVESGKVSFVGAPVEVHKKVEYVVNSGLTRTKFSTNNKKEDKNMSKNDCPNCLKKINAVIANTESGFVEADREWLETLSETALDKAITPKVIKEIKEVEKTIEVNKLSKEDQADLDWAKQQRKERRTTMIQGIQANTEKDQWPDAEFVAMNDAQIERLYKTVVKEDEEQVKGGHYIAGAQINVVGKKQKDGLFPVGVTMEDK